MKKVRDREKEEIAFNPSDSLHSRVIVLFRDETLEVYNGMIVLHYYIVCSIKGGGAFFGWIRKRYDSQVGWEKGENCME